MHYEHLQDMREDQFNFMHQLHLNKWFHLCGSLCNQLYVCLCVRKPCLFGCASGCKHVAGVCGSCAVTPRPSYGLSTGFVCSIKHSTLKALKWCSPVSFTFLTASTAEGLAISLEWSTITSLLSSSKGFPRFSIALTREQTSLMNEAWTLVVWS